MERIEYSSLAKLPMSHISRLSFETAEDETRR